MAVSHSIPADLVAGVRTGDDQTIERGFLALFPALVAQADAELHDRASSSRVVERAFLQEPLPGDHPLWTLDGVFLTPHVAGDTPEAERAAQALARAQMLRHRAGLPLEHVVRPGAAAR